MGERTITVRVDGREETWLAPTCDLCGHNEATRVRQARTENWSEGNPISVTFDCANCDRLGELLAFVHREEIHRLREPQRLQDRLAEVRAGRGW